MAHGQALAVLGLLMAGDAQGREHKIIKMSRIWQIFRNIYFFSNNFFMNSEPQALYGQLVEPLTCFPIIPRPGPWWLRLSDRPGMWKRNLIWLIIRRCSQYEDESEDDDLRRYDDEDSGEEMEDRREEGDVDEMGEQEDREEEGTVDEIGEGVEVTERDETDEEYYVRNI